MASLERVQKIKRVQEMDAKLFWGQLMLTMAYLNIGELKEAEAVVRKLSSWRSRMTDAERKVLLFEKYIINGDLREQLRTCRELMKMVPAFVPFPFNTGLIAYRVNRLREARALFVNIDAKNSFVTKWEDYWSLWAKVEHLLGNYQRELEISRKWGEIFPESRDAFAAELRACIALGKIQEMKDNIDQIYTLSGGANPGRNFLMLAWELKAHGYEKKAAEWTKQAIQWYRNRPAEELQSVNMQRQLFDLLYFSLFRVKEDVSPVSQLEQSDTIIMGSSRHERIVILEQIAEDLITREPDNKYYRLQYGMLMATLGQREKALEVMDWLRKLKPEYLEGIHIAYQAVIAAHLGEKDRAVALLQEAFHNGYAYGLHYHSDPRWEPLRDHPAFLKFIQPHD